MKLLATSALTLIVMAAVCGAQDVPRTGDLHQCPNCPGGCCPAYRVIVHPRPDDPTVLGCAVKIGTRGCGGSGMSFMRDGDTILVLTAGHVYGGSNNYVVEYPDGRRFRARLLGREYSDQKHGEKYRDMALLAIDNAPADLPYTALREDEPRPGEKICKVGYPAAVRRQEDLQWGTVTRSGSEDKPLLTNLNLRSGDSGGGVCDENGWLVGLACQSKWGPGFYHDVITPVSQIHELVNRCWLGDRIKGRRRRPPKQEQPDTPSEPAPPRVDPVKPEPPPVVVVPPAPPPWAITIQNTVTNTDKNVSDLSKRVEKLEQGQSQVQKDVARIWTRLESPKK